MSKIAIIQPLVPTYRKPFFDKLAKSYDIDIFTYKSPSYTKTQGFGSSNVPSKHIASVNIYKCIFSNIMPLLKNSYRIIILCSEMKFIGNWPLLIVSRLLQKKVILWGHGLNAALYEKHSKHMPIIRKIMYRLADGAWFYTENEREIWSRFLPNLKSVALGNTVSTPTTDKIYTDAEKFVFKTTHKIHTQINFIYCARFSSERRRIDLLLKIIDQLDPTIFGFIIIGNGHHKPNFSKYCNVYDNGSLYDDELKGKLFSLADAYIQPAWTGLSIVEAMAYGKPILTLKRSSEVLHGVEYGYIEHKRNGMIFSDINALINFMKTAKSSEYAQLGLNAKKYYHDKLSMDNMVSNAVHGIHMLYNP